MGARELRGPDVQAAGGLGVEDAEPDSLGGGQRFSLNRMFTPAGKPLTGAKPLASKELPS